MKNIAGGSRLKKDRSKAFNRKTRQGGAKGRKEERNTIIRGGIGGESIPRCVGGESSKRQNLLLAASSDARSFYISFAKITLLGIPRLSLPAAFELQCLRYQWFSPSTSGTGLASNLY
jgi:hypothetical protein